MNYTSCSACKRQIPGGSQFCPYCANKIINNDAHDITDYPPSFEEKSESDIAIITATEYIHKNDYVGARTYLEELVSKPQVSPIIHYLYFKSLFSNGKVIVGSPDYVNCLTHLKLAIEMEPDLDEGVAYIHFCNFLDNRQTPDAFKELELAYNLLPEDGVIKFNYAVMLFNQKDIVKAKHLLEELKNSITNPDEIYYYYLILWFLSQISYYNENYYDAIIEITDSIKYVNLSEDRISDYNLHCYLGGYLWMAARDGEAIQALKYAQTILPDHPFAKALLAATRGFFRKKKILLIHGR